MRYKPARCRNNNVYVILDTPALLFISNAVAAAKYSNGTDARKIRQALHLLVNLLGQLARWRKDQRTDLVLIGFADMVQYRQQVSPSFPGPGLGAGDNILPL